MISHSNPTARTKKKETKKTTIRNNVCSLNTTTIDNVVIEDTRLPNTTFKLYCILAMLAGINDVNDTRNCTVLDNSIIKDKSISVGAFRLYCILARFAGINATPVATITYALATFMGCSESTARRRVKELTQKGIVEHKICKISENMYDKCFIVHDCIRDKGGV